MFKAFIDTETTGLNLKKCGVHQVACMILDHADQFVDEFNLEFKPSKMGYTEGALAKTRLTIEQVHARPMTHTEAFERFIEKISQHVNRYDRADKLQFIAYNSRFDEEVIRTWFADNGNDFYGAFFWSPSICLQSAAAWFLRDHRMKLENFKLASVCEFAGIEFNEDEAHDALYDIRKSVELYLKLI